MTTGQVVETSVTVNNNSPIHDQDYIHPDDHTQPFDIYYSANQNYFRNKKRKTLILKIILCTATV